MADAAAGQPEAVQQQEVVAAVQEELMKDVASLEAADAALNAAIQLTKAPEVGGPSGPNGAGDL